MNVQTSAQRKVQRAVKRGDLTRAACEVCGTEPADGHHDDYSKPLEVRWLCRFHHSWLHREGGSVDQMVDAMGVRA